MLTILLMILIYTALRNIVIASNEIIEEGKIKVTRLDNNRTDEYLFRHTNFKVISNKNPGKYLVTMLYNNEKTSKTITIT